jgi:hypothetical protein
MRGFLGLGSAATRRERKSTSWSGKKQPIGGVVKEKERRLQWETWAFKTMETGG